MFYSTYNRDLADLTHKFSKHSFSASENFLSPSHDIHEELSQKTLHKITKMLKKNKKLSLNLNKQIKSFKAASKYLVDNSIDHGSKLLNLTQEVNVIKNNYDKVLNASNQEKKIESLENVSQKLRILQEMHEEIKNANQKVIETEKEIFKKEIENLELKRRLDEIENSISMFANEKENQCRCSVF